MDKMSIFQCVPIKYGNKTTNSISKIKKIRALTKKCIEKGVQKLVFLKNPHSNGDGFSWALNSLKERTSVRPIITLASKAIISISNFNKIIYWQYSLLSGKFSG